MRTNGRNWYEVYLLVLTVGFAVAGLATGSTDQVITATFPTWTQSLWYDGLVIGALLALVGIALRTVPGLLLEQAGLFILSVLCVVFSILFLAFAVSADVAHSMFVVVLVASYGVLHLARVLQIRDDIRSLRSGSIK